jgi:hypothetical protein
MYNSSTKRRLHLHVIIGYDPGLSQEAPFTFRDFRNHIGTSETRSSKYKRVEFFDSSNPETQNPIHTKTLWDFTYWDFAYREDEGFIPFSSLGVETLKPIYLLGSFRGFASRGFAICEDMRSCACVPGS